MIEIRQLSAGGWCVDTGRKWYVIRPNGRVATRIASASGVERRPATREETFFAKWHLRAFKSGTNPAAKLTHLFDPPKKPKDFQGVSCGVAGATGLRKPRSRKGLAAVGRFESPNKPRKTRND